MEINDFYPRKRLIFFGAATVIFIALLTFSYGRLMLRPQSEPKTRTIITERGAILDRDGKILAIQTTLYNIALTKSAIPDVMNLALVLSPITGIDPNEIAALIERTPGDFLYLKKKISQGECDAIREAADKYKLRGIRLEPVISRTYPENALASQVIGFMGDDGEGLSGIEYAFQNVLAPQIKENSTEAFGSNVVLTIDANLQYRLEQIARKSIDETQAESLVMIAADAKTGEILSYISLPAANLNTYPEASETEKTDRPALYAYEPGSVFKIFSTASFLQLGGISDSDTFYCDGVFSIDTPSGEKIRITCLDHHGYVNARKALEVSCNDAVAQMSQTVQSEAFLNMLRNFGFGEKTGIELPSETRGQLKTVTDNSWSARSKPTIAMGQEVAVSALQMVEAATAFANGGVRVKLSLVSKIVDTDGTVTYEHRREPLNQVISPENAALLLSYMESTARFGTGYRAAVGDVPIAVKTGTAQMRDPETGAYSDTDFLSNCIALFPADDPQIVLDVFISKARAETLAGRIAAPVIAEASNAIIDQMGFSRKNAASVVHSGLIEIPKTEPVVLGSVIPDFTGLPKRMLTSLFQREDINVVITGDGWVVSQSPPAGTPVTEGMTIELRLE